MKLMLSLIITCSIFILNHSLVFAFKDSKPPMVNGNGGHKGYKDKEYAKENLKMQSYLKSISKLKSCRVSDCATTSSLAFVRTEVKKICFGCIVDSPCNIRITGYDVKVEKHASLVKYAMENKMDVLYKCGQFRFYKP